MISPIPVSRYLVPEPPSGLAALPPGYTLLDQAITAGLPHRMTLDADLTLTLSLPTGLAREWLQADGHAIIAQSQSETDMDMLDASRAARRAAPRLLVRGAKNLLIGVVPLTIGVVRSVGGESAGASGVLVSLVVIAYDLRAGNVRGPGDWGGRITLGWRRADKGADTFEPPPLNPQVIPRLPQPRESLVGNVNAPAETNTLATGNERLRQARDKWRFRQQIGRKRRGA